MSNADKVDAGLYIELGGEKVKLAANFGTLIRYEKKTGKSAYEPVRSVSDTVSFVWAGLGGDASGKSIEDVAELLSSKNLDEVREFMNRLFSASSSGEEDEKNEIAGENPVA